MKYTVAWVEVHQETVDANNEDAAIEMATKNRVAETYYTVVDVLTRVEMHNPASDLLKELQK